MDANNQSRSAHLARRIGGAAEPTVRLVREPRDARLGSIPEFSGLVEALVDGAGGLDTEHPYAVLGGPGTGKSSVLVEAAVRHILSGGAADSVMFFAPSKEAAAATRARIFARLAGDENYASTGAVVRSVHSWAFAVFRAVRTLRKESPPRLMTGAEHDIAIREILLGTLKDGNRYWPENTVPALGYVGFARLLRDFLLRATERNVSAADLKAYGERYGRPMWEAAGHFLEEFAQIQRLGSSQHVNASELLYSALAALEEPEGQEWLLRQREKTELILVDDAQNLDPASAELIESFMVPGIRTVIAGDPDQCVFHFRGASEDFLTRHAEREENRVVLSASHRLTGQMADAVNSLRTHLPALPTRVALRGREQELEGAENSPSVVAVEAGTTTARNLHLADVVRRAHLENGVAWRDIAVIVRSQSSVPALRRVLMNHGVPVTIDPSAMVLAEQPLVRTLLLAVEASYRPLLPSEVEHLLASPVGGADAVMVRRVQRAVARAVRRARAAGRTLPVREDGSPAQAADLLTHHLADPETYAWVAEFFGPREAGVLERIHAVLSAGREAVAASLSSEMVLWKVWQATQLSSSLQAHALRGGTLGAQADQDLDAVMNLFDLAGDFAERNPHAGVESLVREVRGQELPTGGRDRRGDVPQAVEILPAHAAAGREWRVVVVSDLQEDTWPAGPTVGGLFGQLELVDLVDRGIEPGTPVSRAAEAVQEERRLFSLAISRAREKTVLCYVNGIGEEPMVPSRFLRDVEDVVASEEKTDDTSPGEEPEESLPRVLAIEPLVAELRDAVMDPERPGHERDAAAESLAKLAEAGIFGADPRDWWGAAAPSTEASLAQGGELRLSPSRLESLQQCSLREFLGGHGGVREETAAMRIGTLVHGIAEEIVAGLELEEAQAIVRAVLPLIDDAQEWQRAGRLERWEKAVADLHGYITGLQADAGAAMETEQALRADIGELPDGTRVVLSGKVDLLVTTTSKDGDTMTAVYDFKTGKKALPQKDAEASLQLAAYQYLVGEHSGSHYGQPGGALLVYPATGSAKVATRKQSPQGADDREGFQRIARDLAERAAGPKLLATPGAQCQFCEFLSLCPAKSAGKQVV